VNQFASECSRASRQKDFPGVIAFTIVFAALGYTSLTK